LEQQLATLEQLSTSTAMLDKVWWTLMKSVTPSVWYTSNSYHA
jgi:uncharacterized membrane protein